MRIRLRKTKKITQSSNQLKKMDEKMAGKYLAVAQFEYKKHSRVKAGFWPKFRRFMGKVPFSDDLLAAYFCAFDEKTPRKVRGVLLAALAYFILPIDFVPDFIIGLGFSDDATVLMTAFGLVSQYVKPEHKEKAREALEQELKKRDDE